MPFIGRQPVVGNFVKLDAITTSATTTFALTNGGVAYYPQSPNHCLVSLNGILQAPTDSFTISGSNIVFSSALTTNDVIDFIIVLGDVLNIGTPSDNTVSLAKLTATGTKDSTTFLRGDNTFAVPAGGTNTPAFSVYRNTTQSISNATATKVQFNTERFDTDNAFDSTTNYRFTVPSGKGGKYVFTAGFRFGDFANGRTLLVYKNGSALDEIGYINFGNTSPGYSPDSQTVFITDLSVGDYIEIYAKQFSGSSANLEGLSDGWYRSYFSGFKLI